MGRLLLVFVLLMSCFCLIGCLALTPDQQKLFDDLDKRYKTIEKMMQDTDAQVKRLREKKALYLEKLKNGELSASDAAELITMVSSEIDEAVTRYNNLQAEAKIISQDLKELNESGLPWWSIAIKIALGIGISYLTKKNIGLGSAVGLLVKSIENGQTQEDIKKRVSNAKNTEIEKAVLKLPG